MADYVIGPVSQIPPGEGRNFMVAEQMIAVFRTREGTVHATQPECPHRRGPLADGLVGPRYVVCPLHDRMYSFATGEGIGNDCKLAIYPARLSGDGDIILTIDAA